MRTNAVLLLCGLTWSCASRPDAPTYSVGGDVTGLQGGPLTLSNGTNRVTLNSDGQFTLAAGVLGGAPYQITVISAPAGQTCSVQHAGGTVADANVNTVHVVCSAKVFQVSGYVQGSGTVTVQNGNEVISVDPGGAFQFPTGLPEGTPYAVTATPGSGQTCAVQNANGVVGGAMANIAVTCQSITYSVGGTVSGLTGALGLALNHTSGVRVTQDGNFVFPALLAGNANYNAAVVVQPVGQTCLVNNSNGVIDGESVASLAVTCTTNPVGYTVRVTASGVQQAVSLMLNGNETLQVSGDDVYSFTTVLTANDTYAVTLGTVSGNQTCSLGGRPSGVVGNFSISDITLVCATYTAFSNNSNAVWVLGQPDFVSSGNPDPPDANSLNYPYGAPAAANGIVYVADYSNSRIMGWTFPPAQNGADALLQIGQRSFAAKTGTTSRTALDYPFFVATDGNVLVTDSADGYSAVVYAPVPVAPGGAVRQSAVIGQHGDFSGDNYYGCVGDELAYPYGAFLAANHLFIADTYNNRIVMWNTIPTTGPGAPTGDLFFGASDANACEPSGGGADGLNRPTAVWSDGNRVIVADTSNARVLVWNSMPNVSNHAPDLVLGQPDFNTVGYSSTTRSTLNAPVGVAMHNNQLFVLDRSDNRILIWNALPSNSGAPADVVLGQPSADPLADVFTLNASGTTQQTMNSPTGMIYADGFLLVVDSGNNRLVAFAADPS